MIKYLKVAFFLYNIGLFGMLGSKRHLVLVLMAFELVLVGLSIIITVSSVYMDDMLGLYYSILLITIGAAESSIGLTLVVLFFKLNGFIAFDYVSKIIENYSMLKG